MTTIASKNLYDLLGNDPELDPDREPEPPTKALDKPVARIGKRDGAAEKPVKEAAARPAGGAHRGVAREERGGSLSHRGGRPERSDGQRGEYRQRGEGRERRERGEYRGRGSGRGDRNGRDRGGPARNDRHSQTGVGEHDKQAAHGWGAEQDGNAELADERAGDAIANAESRNEPGLTSDTNAADPAFANGPDDTRNGEAAEPEDKTKSYDDYLAEQAAKRKALAGEGALEVRKANEGSKQKFPEGKAFSRDPEAENFMVGAGGKARKAKETGEKKERVQLEGSYYAPHDSGERGGRGGRGGARGGGRGRGGEGFRGGEGRGRGGRGGRGEGRGGAPRGGADRGHSARGGVGFNATDDSAFPALGA